MDTPLTYAEMVVAPSLTPDSYTPRVNALERVIGCSSLSHPG